jgi:hypothetical protein
MTPMALTCLWKSKWKISSCSHLAKQVDIWALSWSRYSSRGVVKFHFRIWGEGGREHRAGETLHYGHLL